jgi:Fe-S-cluster-containing hydrogenase component 2
MGVSICPVRAYQLDKESWKVVFDQDRCIACGLCVDACPALALKCEDHLTPNGVIKLNVAAGAVSSTRPCRSSPLFQRGPVPVG